MKRWVFASIALACLIGCSSQEPASQSTVAPKAETATPEPAKPPVASVPVKVSEPVASPLATPKTTSAPTPSGGPRNVPERIHQLKDLAVTDISANGHRVKAWVMDDDSRREEGMMFLKESDVRDDQGMIFVFPTVQVNDGRHGFWMANCPLGLDIIYIGKDKKVINVGDGRPFDRSSVQPGGDYFYVLELKHGVGKKYGIKKGSVIGMPAGLKTSV